MIELLIAAALVLPTFFAWAAIHEFSHYVVARWRVGVKSAKFRLYPHKRRGRFMWASITYWPERNSTPYDEALICIAPRFPDALGCWAVAFAGLFDGMWFVIWTVVFGGAVVDLIVGSIGWNPHSDLRKVAAAANKSPWMFRIGGAVTLLWTVVVWLFFGLDNLREIL